MTGKISKNASLKLIKECTLITIGAIIYALGWTIFLLPNNLIGGGVSGLASIIFYATGIPMSITYFVLNILLLILAMKILGTSFGGKTIYAIVMLSVMLHVVPQIIPAEFIKGFVLPNGPLICTILGGILTGIGIGLPISQGGSTGGTDIVALIWCKYRPTSPGRAILIVDTMIILSSLAFPSYTENHELLSWTDKIARLVYGLMQAVVSGYAIDLYLSGTKQSVQAFIFTKNIDRMADAIVQELHRGVTVFPAQGWYTKEEKRVLMVVTKKTDLSLLLRYVKTIDPDAFISISSVIGVYGKGFEQIKEKGI